MKEGADLWYAEGDAVFTAKDHAGNADPLPSAAILFFMGGGVEYALRTRDCVLLTEKLPRFLKGGPVYAFRDHDLCFLDGGRGAPQAADTLETIAALGVRTALCVGMIGAFREGLVPGDVVTPERAYVEEGTSLHYRANIEYARSDPALFAALTGALGARTDAIVSTDAVFRQTFDKERLWRAKGISGVDMETSALMCVGAHLGVRVASVLMVSDAHPLEAGAAKWAWRMTGEMRASLFDRAIEFALSHKE